MKKFVALFFIVLFYILISIKIGYPYRLFPSDDQLFTQMVSFNNFDSLLKTYNPVFLLMLSFFKYITPFFTSQYDFLFVSNIVCTILTTFLLIYILKRLNLNTYLAFTAAIIVMFSAWTANYNFMYSYTILASTLFIISLALLIEAKCDESNSKKALLFTFSSGMIAGLYFWSSSSAVPILFFEMIFVGCIFFKNILASLKKVLLWCGGVFVVVISFFGSSFIPYLLHLMQNIHTVHYTYALQRFGYIPKTLFFSFFRILDYYSPCSLFLLITCAAFCGIYVFNKKFINKSFLTLSEQIVFLLGIFVFANAFLVDILATTKLARTYYPIFLVSIIFILGAIQIVLNQLNKTYLKYKKYAIILLIVILSADCAFNAVQLRQLFVVKQYTPHYLANLKNTIIYTLSEDPQGMDIDRWLEDYNVNPIAKKDLSYVILANRQKHVKTGLLLSAKGNKSGYTILKQCILSDNKLNIQVKPLKRVLLPYFAYYPSFFLEEEISQALYFQGKIPDYRDADKQMELFIYQ